MKILIKQKRYLIAISKQNPSPKIEKIDIEKKEVHKA